MANLGMTFKPEETEAVSFEALPVGEYEAEILDTDVGPTKTNSGIILKVTWRVISGEFENRRIWQNLNIQNDSAQAQKIGQGQLKQICEAAGYNEHMEDSEVMHGWQARIIVGMGKAQNGYEAKPEVKSVKALVPDAGAGKAPVQQRQSPPTQPTQAQKPFTGTPAAAKPAGARPWGNRATA